MTSLRQRLRLKRHALNSLVRRVHGLPRSFDKVKICTNPIFVIGAPRSGTTFLGWSLDHHSWLWTSGELTVIREIFGDTTAVERALEHAEIAGKGSWLIDQDVERVELLARLGTSVNALYTSRSRSKRWLDHTPQHTLLVDLLGEMFPGAVFIHLLRDGRQVVHSMTHFLDALPEEKRRSYGRVGWTIPWLDFEVVCETWRDYVETAMRFADTNPERCLTISHSRFVTEEWRAYRDVFRFLAIPFEHRPIAYARVERTNSTFPSARLREYGNPWTQWTPEQRNTFVRIAGETMVRHGLATRAELALSAEGPMHAPLGSGP